MAVLASLPILTFGLVWAFLAARDAWSSSFIRAAVAWGICTVANTEVLSLFGALSPRGLVAAWTVETLAAAGGVWWRREQLRERLHQRPLRVHWNQLAWTSPVICIVLATGLIAWIAPPNTWDSMTYHMAKVAHWAADGSVANYPTNILWQLIYGPFAEFAVLQFQVLAGSDQFANLPQWFSMVGSLVGVALIARQLGASTAGQIFAVTVAATLPIGILEASSTQADWVVTFWLVCAVALALEFWERKTSTTAAWFAGSLGLALLAKGNAYFFAAPLVCLIGLWTVARLRGRAVVPAVLMIAIPIALNMGFYARNEILSGNPLASSLPLAQTMIVTRISPRTIVSNLVRDASVQFATPSPTLNHILQKAVVGFHNRILKMSANDPNTTYGLFAVNDLSFDEDFASDPLQAVLVVVAVAVAFGLGLRRAPPILPLYALTLVLGFVVFAAVEKWQPWHTRIELPLMVAATPLVGAIVSRMAAPPVAVVIGAVLVATSVPWVLDNQIRPLIDLGLPTSSALLVRNLGPGRTVFNTSRNDMMFVEQKQLKAPYVSAVQLAVKNGCGEIGFWGGFDDWEYPLWALANQSGSRIRVDDVFVTNESSRATQFGSKPCLVVAVVPQRTDTIAVGGVPFTRIADVNGVATYMPSS